MVVSLIQADIDHGVPGDCLRDPVALALQRITGVRWRVDRQICYPDAGGKHRPFVTPKQLNRFLSDFDDGKPVKPISFELS